MISASKIKSSLCLFIGLLVTMHLSATEVYKWTDENGQVHYAEKPPHENESADRLDIQEPPAEEKTVRQYNRDRDRLLQVMEEERQQKREKAREEEQEKQAMADKCATIEKRLAGLQQGGTFYTKNENGERDYLTEEEITAEIGRLQKAREQYCK